MTKKNSSLFVRIAMLAACALSGIALTASAGDYLLVKAPTKAADWKDPSFYDASTGAPSGTEADVVYISKMVPEIVVNGRDTETMDFLGSVSRIIVSNSVFAIDVAAGETATFAGSIHDKETFRGLFEKRGDGELRLTAYKKWMWSQSDTTHDYDVDILVSGGVLRLPPADEGTYNCYKRITVAEGAKVVSPNRAAWQVRSFAGGGTVTNESGTAVDILTYEYHGLVKKADFTGSIGGKFNFSIRQKGRMSFATDLNTFEGRLTLGYENGELCASRFGKMADAASSLGKGDNQIFLTGPNVRLVYTGAGEVSDRKFYCYYVGPATIDGGETGGLVLTGDFPLWTTIADTTNQRNLVLAGDNANECVIAGRFDPDNNSRKKNPTQWHITKRGSGTWRFTADDHKNLDGLFAVENGVLAFDSIAPRGAKCALGTSALTYSAGGEISEATRTPYAFLLGNAANASEVGLMEYRGAKAGRCDDRPVALAGVGGFKSRVGAGRMAWSGVTTASSAPGTLVLSGDDVDAGNYVCNVTNGAGVVSVRKEGSGTWTMGGPFAFTGGLEVLGGTLIMREPGDEYRYYRFVIKEIGLTNESISNEYASVWTGNTWGSVSFGDIGLYDAEGIRQNLDLVHAADNANLRPCEAAYSSQVFVYSEASYFALENAFDDIRQGTNGAWTVSVYLGSSKKQPCRTMPEHWISVDMRLPESAGRIHQYDLCSGGQFIGPHGGRTPTAVALYGSTDGVRWDLLRDEFDETTARSSNNYQWLAANKVFEDGKERGGARHTGGWMLKKTAPEAVQYDLCPVTVANGAALKFEGETPPRISHLKLDAATTGSIEGFAFAESGTIEIADLSRDTVGLGVNLSGSSGTENLLRWTVIADGKVNAKVRVAAAGNGLAVVRIGTVVVLR